MSKKVCAFVWNHFTNDARVLRECSALAEAGYEVDLIAVHDAKNEDMPFEEQHPNGFRVIRVKNRMKLLNDVLRFIRKIKKKKATLFITYLLILDILIGLNAITSWVGVSVYLGILVLAALGSFVLTKTKIPKAIVRGYIFAQMVRWGRKRKVRLLSFQ